MPAFPPASLRLFGRDYLQSEYAKTGEEASIFQSIRLVGIPPAKANEAGAALTWVRTRGRLFWQGESFFALAPFSCLRWRWAVAERLEIPVRGDSGSRSIYPGPRMDLSAESSCVTKRGR